ncbi:MAG: DMT family transporter [Methanococcaceae archaeon]
MKNKLLLYWKPLFAVTAWGISFIATKIALRGISPITIINLRLILGVILLSIIAVGTKQSFKIEPKKHLGILVLALVASFHLWIQVTGLQYTTASNTGWIIGITPVFMALLGISFFKEKLSALNIAGIVISTFGLLLLISKGDLNNIGFLANKGDFMVLASAFTWSVYSILNKKISMTYSPLMTTLFLFMMMAIILIPFNVSAEVISSVVNLTIIEWGAVLFLGFICSGVSYVLWAKTLKEMDSARVGAFLYIEPFITVFTAAILLKESLTLLVLFSGIIITAGVIMVNRK